jgi:SAM-dependent methyltransferase
VIQGRTELQHAYRDEGTVRQYVETRFRTPLGGLLHARQVSHLRALIEQHRIREAGEIAPGPARLTVDLASSLYRVTLLDASFQMLSEARRRLSERGFGRVVRMVQADAFQLPLAGQFELVYSFRLIRHFERADRVRLYQQIARILRPGGRLVFDAVNEVMSAPLRAKAEPGEFVHYDALLRPAELKQELQEAGFVLESLTGVQHRYSLLMACQIYLAPRSGALARALMEVIDRIGGGEPLEWIVVCRRG